RESSRRERRDHEIRARLGRGIGYVVRLAELAHDLHVRLLDDDVLDDVAQHERHCKQYSRLNQGFPRVSYPPEFSPHGFAKEMDRRDGDSIQKEGPANAPRKGGAAGAAGIDEGCRSGEYSSPRRSA